MRVGRPLHFGYALVALLDGLFHPPPELLLESQRRSLHYLVTAAD